MSFGPLVTGGPYPRVDAPGYLQVLGYVEAPPGGKGPGAKGPLVYVAHGPKPPYVSYGYLHGYLRYVSGHSGPYPTWLLNGGYPPGSLKRVLWYGMGPPVPLRLAKY